MYFKLMNSLFPVLISSLELFSTWLLFSDNQRIIIWLLLKTISGQLPTRTIPHCTGIGPNEWFYWFVVVLVGSCPSGE